MSDTFGTKCFPSRTFRAKMVSCWGTGPMSAQAAWRLFGISAAALMVLTLSTVTTLAADVYAGLDLNARKGLQVALIWTGDYGGAVDGAIGRTTVEAVRGYQRRIGARPTGLLSAAQADRLLRDAERGRQAVGYAYERDAMTGAVIGLPKAVVSWKATTRRGARYADPPGLVEIETVRMPAAEVSLPALYTKLATPSAGRSVDYSVERGSWFVVTGIDGRRRFYSRFHRLVGGDVIGFSFAYPERQSDRFGRVAVAMSNDFALAVALAEEGLPREPGLVPPAGELWVIVASRIEIAEAVAVAQLFLDRFPQAFVVRSANGRYAVVAGSMTSARWRRMKAFAIDSGLVPADTFLSDGDKLVEVMWRPPSATAAMPPPSVYDDAAATAAAPHAPAIPDAATQSAAAAPTPAAADPAPPRAPPSATVKGSGTGFLIAERQLVTNAHVVDDCASLTVGGHGAATVLARDDQNDLALLQLGVSPGIAPLAFAATPTKLGASVAALGYPLRQILAPSINITTGIVSSLAGLGGDSRYLQITAPVQPGNSGGPLVDDRGLVVGVVSAKLDTLKVAVATGDVPQAVNFAIRKEVVQIFLAANGIAMPMAPAGETVLDPQEIAEKVAPATLLVECR